MSKQIKIIDSYVAKESTRGTRRSPAAIILESLDGDYKTMRDMSERYSVHTETMRRLCRAVDPNGLPRVKAPSKAVQSGGMTIYLFTTEDVAELDAYFSKKGYVIDSEDS